MSVRTVRVGVTGAMGAGKSTVAAALARRGAAVIDADRLARRAVEDPLVLQRIARELGSHYVVGGRLDRAATGRAVFADAAARRRLEAIVHPWVRSAATAEEAALLRAEPPATLVVHDVPLLFETGLDQSMDATVLVRAPLPLRRARIAARGGDPDSVERRDEAQWSTERKAALADFVIENDAGEDALEVQVSALWTALRMLA
jgi:dephospho-CoA kinase